MAPLEHVLLDALSIINSLYETTHLIATATSMIRMIDQHPPLQGLLLGGDGKNPVGG